MTRGEAVDVLIVGAGPAGSSLALRLARAGCRVRLVDRAVFPRFKPCGEFISPECLPILDDLGALEPLLDAGAHRVEGMRLFGWGQRAHGCYGRVARGSGGDHWGLGLRREVFDRILLDRARARRGVEFAEGVRIGHLLRDGRGRVVGAAGTDRSGREVEFRARFTVGADGVRSRVVRDLGLARPTRWLRRHALVARYEGVPPLDTGEVHLFDSGYFAGCSVDQGLFTLNLVMASRSLQGSDLDSILDSRAADHPSLGPRLARARRVEPVRAIGPLAFSTTRQVVPGAALVGDACGYVDPMTGEGISFALRGAEILAGELVRALAEVEVPGPRELAAYPHLRRKEIGFRLRQARGLQRGVAHPWLARAVLTLLARRPALVDLLVERTGGVAPPRAVRGPWPWLRALAVR
ncbi:MAG: NAD(P)/FAD-dependent oxidoreductase [Acidobacteriota bacterium]|nr:NAD(P)/FAD-dependent oxidoreductase [Acidobacteriota bacterium]MDQ7088482.1 NAD(P)/FAD-dependent oxidoreductase [Acidobacteriota bacterium]